MAKYCTDFHVGPGILPEFRLLVLAEAEVRRISLGFYDAAFWLCLKTSWTVGK